MKQSKVKLLVLLRIIFPCLGYAANYLCPYPYTIYFEPLNPQYLSPLMYPSNYNQQLPEPALTSYTLEDQQPTYRHKEQKKGDIELAQEKLIKQLPSQIYSEYTTFEELSSQIKKISEEASFVNLNRNKISPICTMVYQNPNKEQRKPYRYIVFKEKEDYFILEEAIISELNSIEVTNGRQKSRGKNLGWDALISLPLNELSKSYGEVYVLKNAWSDGGDYYCLAKNMVPKFDFSLFYNTINSEKAIDSTKLAMLKEKLVSAIDDGRSHFLPLNLRTFRIPDREEECIEVVIQIKDGKMYLGTKEQLWDTMLKA